MLVVTLAAALSLAACSDADSGTTANGSPSAVVTSPAGRDDVSAQQPPRDRTADAEPACDVPCYGDAETAGTLSEDTVVEMSGMAASVRTPGLYYVVGDEPGTPEVVAVREDGTPVARLELDGMDPENAEALAVGPCGDDPDASCLYVGDIGDHVGRDHVVVYRAPEPDLADPPDQQTLDADALEFTYEGGPTDAEALLVDPDGRPLVVSKAPFDRDTGETGSTRLYRGPADGGELEVVADIELPEPEEGFLAALAGNVVTDASADLGAGRVLLRTYDEILEYRAPEAGADVATFPDWPLRRVPAGNVLQAETVAYAVDDCGYLTTSELTGTIDVVRCTD
ncbi:hypothetical protein [Jiangella mangrovi]|uniref:Uncharacterized protein n=1 Tax=Jiangella mangrovi TaxID=1524084 RepID=A0A7W9LKV7_9ACTN|nr:hypothetical protein [Jiangella mangrovi]MBB5787469.1 hypothetical protein [Jiangella mangrovi]